MTAEKDPRIEAVAKLLFTGPLLQYNADEWDDVLIPAIEGNRDEALRADRNRSMCLMAAEDVLRGIDEAAAKDMLAKNRAALAYELSVEDYYQRHVRGQKAPE
ncbi:hypothetical protein [Rathayibacter sp. AY2B9]|uniref:hypothetical protein n=1 Tax=Rathayibacter sp. AY2B9 TaxID=2080572 RepID=UPI000CE7A627|nr:hypothetical protein [Rathayibacter sp. AY2B9]PPG34496.1 hypothetical protein C5C25_00295 [Rathayibacter sp. AY2B9]